MIETPELLPQDGSLPTSDEFARFKNERDYINRSGYQSSTVSAMDWAIGEIERLCTLTDGPPSTVGMEDEIDRDDPQFNRGVNHVVDLLAKTIDSTDWVAGDGSEDYDEDLAQTLLNILEARGLYDCDEGRFASLPSPTLASEKEGGKADREKSK